MTGFPREQPSGGRVDDGDAKSQGSTQRGVHKEQDGQGGYAGKMVYADTQSINPNAPIPVFCKGCSKEASSMRHHRDPSSALVQRVMGND